MPSAEGRVPPHRYCYPTDPKSRATEPIESLDLPVVWFGTFLCGSLVCSRNGNHSCKRLHLNHREELTDIKYSASASASASIHTPELVVIEGSPQIAQLPRLITSPQAIS